MRSFSLLMLSIIFLAAGGCSRSDKTESVKPPSTPDAKRLKADSERLQEATANAAKARQKAAESSVTPSATP